MVNKVFNLKYSGFMSERLSETCRLHVYPSRRKSRLRQFTYQTAEYARHRVGAALSTQSPPTGQYNTSPMGKVCETRDTTYAWIKHDSLITFLTDRDRDIHHTIIRSFCWNILAWERKPENKRVQIHIMSMSVKQVKWKLDIFVAFCRFAMILTDK